MLSCRKSEACKCIWISLFNGLHCFSNVGRYNWFRDCLKHNVFRSLVNNPLNCSVPVSTCIHILWNRSLELVRAFFPSCLRRNKFLTGFRNGREPQQTSRSLWCLRVLSQCPGHPSLSMWTRASSGFLPHPCWGPSITHCWLQYRKLYSLSCSAFRLAPADKHCEMKTAKNCIQDGMKTFWKLDFAKIDIAILTLPQASLVT